MNTPIFFYILLGIIVLPSLLIAQDKSELSNTATRVFPKAGLVLTNSSIQFSFKKEKSSFSVLETRQEDFLSTKEEQRFSYAIYYDSYSEVQYFKTDRSVHDTYHQSEDIFHSDIRLKYSNYSLYHKGESTQIKTLKKYNDLKYLTKVFITTPHDCLKRTVSFVIPESFEVELIPVNFEGFNIKINDRKDGTNRLVDYTIDTLNGFSDAPNLPGPTHLYPHILILPKSYKDAKESKAFFNSLDSLYAWYYQLVSEVKNEPKELKEIVHELTKESKTAENKIENIFYWVQDNIRYIAFEDGIAGYQPENCQTVYHNRYGDCKGMANLMKHMLLLAGFDARLVWLGTKSIATDYSTPSLGSDNHMICAIKYEDKFIYLDGTEKYINIDNYAERIQGQDVLIENGSSYIKEKIPRQEHQKNTRIFNLILAMNEAQELVGKVSLSERGEAMSQIMYLYAHTPTDEKESAVKKYLAFHDNFTTINNVELPSINREIDSVIIKGDIILKKKTNSFDNETYIYLNPYHLYKDYQLEAERKFPLSLSNKRNDCVNIKFDIPQGLSVSSVPQTIHVENEDFMIDLEYKIVENIIYHDIHIQIPNSEISAKNLAAWNAAVKSLKSAYEEPIVLIKK